MFNISLDKSASNQHCSPEDPGPKYLFYKLGLEGKKLNVKTNGVEDLKILACHVRFRWFKETGFPFVSPILPPMIKKTVGWFKFIWIINFYVGNAELANFIIRGVLLTLMSLFGMVANTLSIIVFRRPEMKSSTINRILISKIHPKLMLLYIMPTSLFY